MVSDLLHSIKGLIIDMDGVLWRDTEPIGDLNAIFARIQTLGLKYILATNNATKTVEEYHRKLNGFGVRLESWQVINAAEATALYLREHYSEGVKVYVVGEPSLKKTLTSYGIRIVDESIADPQVVVASLDYGLTYDKLKHAALLIRSGCDFLGTNPDITLPTPNGFIPGSGTIIRALEIASQTNARMIGKPEPLLYQMALKRLGLKPHQTLAVGDRLETDIAGAQAANIQTALVLSGASTMDQANKFEPAPDYVKGNLSELIFQWETKNL